MNAEPNEGFLAICDGAPPDLVGSLGVRLTTQDGDEAIPRSAALNEITPGIYVTTLIAPDDVGNYILVWDVAGNTVATEALDVELIPAERGGLFAEPGTIVRAVAENLPVGAEVGVRVLKPDGTIVVAHTTSGIEEISTNIFVAEIVAPSIPGQYVIIWDDGDGNEATESLTVQTASSPLSAAIYVRPGHPFEAILEGAPSGLVGQLRVRLDDSQEQTLITFTSAGIAEVGGYGTYIKQFTAAPEDEGTYFVVWDVPGQGYGIDTVIVSDVIPDAGEDPLEIPWRPSVEEVGSILRARTKDNMGNELGTFTDDTRPTDEQVELLISRATAHIAQRVGSRTNLCEDELTSQARGQAVLYTAMLIELSYFPEQIETTSPYKEYKGLFDGDMESLTDAVAKRCGGEGEGSGDADSPGSVDYAFEKPISDLGMNTSW